MRPAMAVKALAEATVLLLVKTGTTRSMQIHLSLLACVKERSCNALQFWSLPAADVAW